MLTVHRSASVSGQLVAAVTVCLLVIAGLHVRGVTAFLECPSPTAPSDMLDMRCCRSVELPKGCECFQVSLTSNFSNFRRPDCPPDLGVRFLLYTPEARKTPVQIMASDQALLATSFMASRPTYLIIHGWTGRAPATWSEYMKDELLNAGDGNVVLVNWRKGAHRVYYQSVANLRTAGAMVAQLAILMASMHGGHLENIHLIGHSLGAHMSGFAGKEIHRLTDRKVGRITGLDPAGLAFDGHPPNARLDKTDAIFVDIIHTDAERVLTSGYGIRSSIGHADFYPNGGVHQPGCPKEVLQFLYLFDFRGPKSVGVCSHIRVLMYFSNSINKCRYDPPTGESACTMGFHASATCRGNFFPATTDKEPFC